MRPLLFYVMLFMGLSGAICPASVWAFDPAQHYVQSQFLPPQLLPPPPAEGSKAWQQQVAAVIQAQKNLSANEIAAMKDEQHVRLEMITTLLGPSFTREKLPKTFALLDHVLAGAGEVSEADKKFWHTRRPYMTDTRVKLYVDPIDNSPSYPSGHTTDSRVLAEVLGMLVPERLADLRARAEVIAQHRVEAGAHYPVDLEGGRILALLIVGSLTANDDFQDDLAAARKETAEK